MTLEALVGDTPGGLKQWPSRKGASLLDLWQLGLLLRVEQLIVSILVYFPDDYCQKFCISGEPAGGTVCLQAPRAR